MKDSVEILCIGTEILLGNIVNTNSQTISRGLADIGMDLYHHTVVGDNPQRLKEALETAFSRNNIVITTGGLGPTYDDLTKETIANYFGLELEMYEPAREWIISFIERSHRTLTENSLKQAMMPQGCIVMENHNGTAPGAIIEGDGRIAIMLPGPPKEMAPMFRDQVIPYLEKRSGRVLRSHCIHFFGIGESALEYQLHEQMEQMTNPTLAPYAKEGEVMLRVTASATDEQQAEELMQPVIKQLYQQYKDYIYGMDVGDLQTAVVRMAAQKGLTLATAESCTGGYVAKRITDVAGSSVMFHCGIVSYANEVKERVLGVRHETLEQYGAVSEQTAQEMARGVRRVSGAEIGISVTGIAGPDGGTPEKPVGLVYIGVNSDWHSEVLKLNLARNFQNERENVRYLASSNALSLALKTILAKK